MARLIDLKKNASSICRGRKNYKHKNRERKNYKHTLTDQLEKNLATVKTNEGDWSWYALINDATWLNLFEIYSYLCRINYINIAPKPKPISMLVKIYKQCFDLIFIGFKVTIFFISKKVLYECFIFYMIFIDYIAQSSNPFLFAISDILV